MMTKTQLRIMKLFASKIAKKFTLQGAGRELGIHQALSYRSSRPLIERKLIVSDENNLYGLNYKENQQELTAIEYLRAADFMANPRNRKFRGFIEEFIRETEEEKFIFLLFGSAVDKANPRDYDVLLFFDSMKKVEIYEKVLMNFAENYTTIEAHVNVDSIEGFREMLMKRDEKNLANEALNKHIIFYGAELFYRILGRERPYA